jgi:hypothetical protein
MGIPVDIPIAAKPAFAKVSAVEKEEEDLSGIDTSPTYGKNKKRNRRKRNKKKRNKAASEETAADDSAL